MAYLPPSERPNEKFNFRLTKTNADKFEEEKANQSMRSMRNSKFSSCFAMLIGVTLSMLSLASAEGADDVMKKLKPFFDQHCMRCHGPEEENGGLRIDVLTSNLDDLDSVDHLQNILDSITTESMPPEDEPQPSDKHLLIASNILRNHINKAKKKHSSGGGKSLRRLTRTEFVNTIEDLLGVHVDEDRLQADGTSGKFESDVTGLYTTDVTLETFLEVSRTAVRQFIASRDLKPGFEVIPTKYSNSIASGSYDITASEVPPAGHLLARLVVWQRNPSDTNRIYIGPVDHSDSHEVTGTADEPQNIDIKIYQQAAEVNWRFQSELSNVKGQEAQASGKKKKKKGKKGKGKAASVDQSNLVEIQESSPINPLILGEIKSARYVSSQPFEFFKDLKNKDRLSDGAAKGIIRKFVTMINRGRPVDAEFVNRLNKVFLLGRRSGEPFWVALEEPLAVSMCSIESMFHLELGKTSERLSLSGPELANRLSYFLWRSAPDAELLALAESKELLKPNVKAEQINRMIGDKRFHRFLNDFTDQWLELERQDVIAVDNRLYTDFSEEMKPSMKRETVEFVAHLIRKNLPLKNLIDSDFLVINSQTAKYYDIPNIRGNKFRAVPKRAADSMRGGILTQAGILMQTGNGERTSIVERGVFVSRKLLGVDPPPPPPNVDALPTDGSNFAKLTAGQLVKAHLTAPQCASCHRKIDPMGLGMEEFDAVGIQRRTERRIEVTQGKKKNSVRFFEVPIETNGRLPNGKRFEGIDGLKKALLANENMLAESFVRALLSYANGRTTGTADDSVVKKIVDQGSEFDFPTFSMMKAVLYSDSIDSQ